MNFDTIYNLVEQRAHNHGDKIPEDPRKRSAVNRPPMKFEQPSPEVSNEQPNERSWQKKPVDPIEDVLSIPPEEIIPDQDTGFSPERSFDDFHSNMGQLEIPSAGPKGARYEKSRGDQKKLEDIYAKDRSRRAQARIKQLERRNADLENLELKDRYIKDLQSKLGEPREASLRKMIDDRWIDPAKQPGMIAAMKKKLGEQGPEGPQGELGSPGELDLDNLPEEPPQRTPEEEARLKEIYAKREARQKQHEDEAARQDRQWELEDYLRDYIGGPPDEWQRTRDHFRQAFEEDPEKMEKLYKQYILGHPDPDTPDLNNPSEPDTRNDSKSTKPSPAKL